jgi:hypothetical protein
MNENGGQWNRARVLLVEHDADYCRRRAAEERVSAFAALDPRARQIHLDMAERYEDLARAIVAFEHYLGNQLEAAANV